MDLSRLNFQPGIGVQASIRARCGKPVNYFPIPGLKEFLLVVFVGHFKYCLSETSIGFILQATLDGSAADFRPHRISDRVFSFVVASRKVGFHIYNIQSFSCEQYQIYFNLWNNGGAHWAIEAKKYMQEEEDQWMLVQSKQIKKNRSFAEILRSPPILSGANRVPVQHQKFSYSRIPKATPSVFDRITWPHKAKKVHFNPAHRFQKSFNMHYAQAKNREPERHQREFQLQIQNRRAKGKKPAKEDPSAFFRPGKECTSLGPANTVCKSWATCLRCRFKGHSEAHCKAQWKKITSFANKAIDWAHDANRAALDASSSHRVPSLENDLLPKQTQEQAPPSTEPIVAPPTNSPPPSQNPSSSGEVAPTISAAMAYQRADPRPFTLNGYQPLEMQHRELMVRAIMRHTPPTHEEFAIVSIHPLPENVLHFPAVHEVVHEFLVEHMGTRVCDVQPSHLGQALVQFVHAHDRDTLVNNGLHPYGEVNFSVVRHNQARNWRAVNFNRECWLMLLGFPLDFWNNNCIQSAISSFRRVLLWENDRRHLARLMVKARVADLVDVPHFLVLTEADGF
jgi:hypothetical protein